MAELSRLTLPDFVKLADVLWIKGAKTVVTTMLSSGIFKKMSIPEHTGNTREFSEIDSNEYLSYKGEGEQAERGKVAQGYTKTLTSYRVAENIGITYEMRTQNKYEKVVSELTNAGRKGPNRMDLDTSLRFTFMASTSYTDIDGRTVATTMGDGFALAYSAHTLTKSSSTYRNILSNNPQLSKGSLEAMERLVEEQTYNNFGEKMQANPTILWTTNDPVAVNTAREYLQSTAAPEGTNSGVTNVYGGRYRHIALRRVAITAAGGVDTTKRYYWGLVDPELFSAYLAVWEEPRLIPPAAGSNAEDSMTDNWDFRARAGYGITIVSGRGFWASKGDGSA